MDFDYIGAEGGSHYWHYITGKTTYVVVRDGDEAYRAFYHRGETHHYLLNVGFDCRQKPFVSFLQAAKACRAKLRALRGV